MRDRLFSAALKRELAGYDAQQVFDRHAGRAGTDDPLALIQYLDLKTYLVGDINTKVDRASMAHSLEVREPLMDHELVEWLATLPSTLKVRGQEGKFLLKKAMEPQLPADVLYRPKMGFSVPLARWFRGPLKQRVRDAVLGRAAREHRLVQPAATCEQLVDAHQSGAQRLQRAAVDAADVRGFPAQRGRRLAGGAGRPARGGSAGMSAARPLRRRSLPLGGTARSALGVV